jgi:hypothetical protein
MFLDTRDNQSLRGVINRLAGSVTAWTTPRLVAAVLVPIVALLTAAVLYRGQAAGPRGADLRADRPAGHAAELGPSLDLGGARHRATGVISARARGAVRASWQGGHGRPGTGNRFLASILGSVAGRADPGRAVLVRARHLLREGRRAVVSRIPLAWLATAPGEQLRAGRPNRAGHSLCSRVPGAGPQDSLNATSCKRRILSGGI